MEPSKMSNDHDVTQYIPANDGWGDAANEASARTIRGKLLKFADWRWMTGKEAEPVENGTRLVALATVALWQRWAEGKPVQEIVRQPGQKLPEREDLGYDDESQWEEGPSGEPQDPWRNTRLVYLVDKQTAEAYTFSTSSWGGRGAVIDLGDQIARMRTVHPDATPVVELRAAEFPTKWGKKSKPVFKVVGWKTAHAEGVSVARPAPAERLISPKEVKKAEDQAFAKEIDDEIPF
jgi:hypothetical protein